MRKNIKKIKILSLIFIIAISAVIAPIKDVSAYNDFYVNNDILFYDPTDTGCGGNTNLDLSSPGGDYAIWNSGATPDEYSLERFAIEVLRYIASKKNVSESDTVTKEHVTALVGFMIGEGGDINNKHLFNPLNSGLNSANLVDGQHQNDGTQSFKSFDAGITATAMTMMGSNQSRLAGILIKKDSTAADFAKTLTYYNQYDGNKAWAEATNQKGFEAYYNYEYSLIKGVIRDYNHTAGIRMGTSSYEQKDKLYVPSSSLKYSSTSDPTESGSSSSCNGSLVSGGMTLEQAKTFMNQYKSLEPKDWVRGTAGTPYKINGTNCAGGSLYNCVAFSQYFINRYTKNQYTSTSDGKGVVKDLIGLGFKDGGHIPKVYAVFSRSTGGSGYGHTGVILGINTTNGKIIIGQASCGDGESGVQAVEVDLAKYSGDEFTYAYTDNNLKSGESL